MNIRISDNQIDELKDLIVMYEYRKYVDDEDPIACLAVSEEFAVFATAEEMTNKRIKTILNQLKKKVNIDGLPLYAEGSYISKAMGIPLVDDMKDEHPNSRYMKALLLMAKYAGTIPDALLGGTAWTMEFEEDSKGIISLGD